MSIIYFIIIISKGEIDIIFGWSFLGLGAGFLVKGVWIILFQYEETKKKFILATGILLLFKISIFIGLAIPICKKRVI